MFKPLLPKTGHRHHHGRGGVTLVELLAVSVILLLMAGTMAALAMGVQTSSEYQQRHGQSLQHGQVALQRMLRTLNEAYANDLFPGFLVFAESVSGHSYPDTIVIWSPDGDPVERDGLPRVNELVVYCPNPQALNELWEIKETGVTRSAPSPSDTASWRSLISDLKTSNTAHHVVLTNLLRLASTADNADSVSARRSVLRFDATLRPSAAQWQQYVAGSRTWESLPWVQGIRSSQTGLRQAWCRVEFQLRPGDSTNDSRESAIPFFGSGAVLYDLHKP